MAMNRSKNSGNKQISILLVEDDLVSQKIISQILQKLSFRVDVVGNGIEALEILKDKHQYDIVFMDISLPGIDGIQIVEKIRQQEKNKQLLIIGLTAYKLEEIEHQCMLAGFDKLLSKPVLLNQLKDIVVEVLNRNINL